MSSTSRRPSSGRRSHIGGSFTARPSSRISRPSSRGQLPPPPSMSMSSTPSPFYAYVRPPSAGSNYGGGGGGNSSGTVHGGGRGSVSARSNANHGRQPPAPPPPRMRLRVHEDDSDTEGDEAFDGAARHQMATVAHLRRAEAALEQQKPGATTMTMTAADQQQLLSPPPSVSSNMLMPYSDFFRTAPSPFMMSPYGTTSSQSSASSMTPKTLAITTNPYLTPPTSTSVPDAASHAQFAQLYAGQQQQQIQQMTAAAMYGHQPPPAVLAAMAAAYSSAAAPPSPLTPAPTPATSAHGGEVYVASSPNDNTSRVSSPTSPARNDGSGDGGDDGNGERAQQPHVTITTPEDAEMERIARNARQQQQQQQQYEQYQQQQQQQQQLQQQQGTSAAPAFDPQQMREELVALLADPVFTVVPSQIKPAADLLDDEREQERQRQNANAHGDDDDERSVHDHESDNEDEEGNELFEATRLKKKDRQKLQLQVSEFDVSFIVELWLLYPPPPPPPCPYTPARPPDFPYFPTPLAYLKYLHCIRRVTETPNELLAVCWKYLHLARSHYDARMRQEWYENRRKEGDDGDDDPANAAMRVPLPVCPVTDMLDNPYPRPLPHFNPLQMYVRADRHYDKYMTARDKYLLKRQLQSQQNARKLEALGDDEHVPDTSDDWARREVEEVYQEAEVRELLERRTEHLKLLLNFVRSPAFKLLPPGRVISDDLKSLIMHPQAGPPGAFCAHMKRLQARGREYHDWSELKRKLLELQDREERFEGRYCWFQWRLRQPQLTPEQLLEKHELQRQRDQEKLMWKDRRTEAEVHAERRWLRRVEMPWRRLVGNVRALYSLLTDRDCTLLNDLPAMYDNETAPSAASSSSGEFGTWLLKHDQSDAAHRVESSMQIFHGHRVRAGIVLRLVTALNSKSVTIGDSVLASHMEVAQSILEASSSGTADAMLISDRKHTPSGVVIDSAPVPQQHHAPSFISDAQFYAQVTQSGMVLYHMQNLEFGGRTFSSIPELLHAITAEQYNYLARQEEARVRREAQAREAVVLLLSDQDCTLLRHPAAFAPAKKAKTDKATVDLLASDSDNDDDDDDNDIDNDNDNNSSAEGGQSKSTTKSKSKKQSEDDDDDDNGMPKMWTDDKGKQVLYNPAEYPGTRIYVSQHQLQSLLEAGEVKHTDRARLEAWLTGEGIAEDENLQDVYGLSSYEELEEFGWDNDNASDAGSDGGINMNDNEALDPRKMTRLLSQESEDVFELHMQQESLKAIKPLRTVDHLAALLVDGRKFYRFSDLVAAVRREAAKSAHYQTQRMSDMAAERIADLATLINQPECQLLPDDEEDDVTKTKNAADNADVAGKVDKPGDADDASTSNKVVSSSSKKAASSRKMSIDDARRIYEEGGAGRDTVNIIMNMACLGREFPTLTAVIAALRLHHMQHRQSEKDEKRARAAAQRRDVLDFLSNNERCHLLMRPVDGGLVVQALLVTFADVRRIIDQAGTGCSTLMLLKLLQRERAQFTSINQLIAALKVKKMEFMDQVREREDVEAGNIHFAVLTQLQTLHICVLSTNSAAEVRHIISACGAGIMTTEHIRSLSSRGEYFSNITDLALALRHQHVHAKHTYRIASYKQKLQRLTAMVKYLKRPTVPLLSAFAAPHEVVIRYEHVVALESLLADERAFTVNEAMNVLRRLGRQEFTSVMALVLAARARSSNATARRSSITMLSTDGRHASLTMTSTHRSPPGSPQRGLSGQGGGGGLHSSIVFSNPSTPASTRPTPSNRRGSRMSLLYSDRHGNGSGGGSGGGGGSSGSGPRSMRSPSISTMSSPSGHKRMSVSMTPNSALQSASLVPMAPQTKRHSVFKRLSITTRHSEAGAFSFNNKRGSMISNGSVTMSNARRRSTMLSKMGGAPAVTATPRMTGLQEENDGDGDDSEDSDDSSDSDNDDEVDEHDVSNIGRARSSSSGATVASAPVAGSNLKRRVSFSQSRRGQHGKPPPRLTISDENDTSMIPKRKRRGGKRARRERAKAQREAALAQQAADDVDNVCADDLFDSEYQQDGVDDGDGVGGEDGNRAPLGSPRRESVFDYSRMTAASNAAKAKQLRLTASASAAQEAIDEASMHGDASIGRSTRALSRTGIIDDDDSDGDGDVSENAQQLPESVAATLSLNPIVLNNHARRLRSGSRVGATAANETQPSAAPSIVSELSKSSKHALTTLTEPRGDGTDLTVMFETLEKEGKVDRNANKQSHLSRSFVRPGVDGANRHRKVGANAKADDDAGADDDNVIDQWDDWMSAQLPPLMVGRGTDKGLLITKAPSVEERSVGGDDSSANDADVVAPVADATAAANATPATPMAEATEATTMTSVPARGSHKASAAADGATAAVATASTDAAAAAMVASLSSSSTAQSPPRSRLQNLYVLSDDVMDAARNNSVEAAAAKAKNKSTTFYRKTFDAGMVHRQMMETADRVFVRTYKTWSNEKKIAWARSQNQRGGAMGTDGGGAGGTGVQRDRRGRGRKSERRVRTAQEKADLCQRLAHAPDLLAFLVRPDISFIDTPTPTLLSLSDIDQLLNAVPTDDGEALRKHLMWLHEHRIKYEYVDELALALRRLHAKFADGLEAGGATVADAKDAPCHVSDITDDQRLATTKQVHELPGLTKWFVSRSQTIMANRCGLPHLHAMLQIVRNPHRLLHYILWFQMHHLFYITCHHLLMALMTLEKDVLKFVNEIKSGKVKRQKKLEKEMADASTNITGLLQSMVTIRYRNATLKEVGIALMKRFPPTLCRHYIEWMHAEKVRFPTADKLTEAIEQLHSGVIQSEADERKRIEMAERKQEEKLSAAEAKREREAYCLSQLKANPELLRFLNDPEKLGQLIDIGVGTTPSDDAPSTKPDNPFVVEDVIEMFEHVPVGSRMIRYLNYMRRVEMHFDSKASLIRMLHEIERYSIEAPDNFSKFQDAYAQVHECPELVDFFRAPDYCFLPKLKARGERVQIPELQQMLNVVSSGWRLISHIKWIQQAGMQFNDVDQLCVALAELERNHLNREKWEVENRHRIANEGKTTANQTHRTLEEMFAQTAKQRRASLVELPKSLYTVQDQVVELYLLGQIDEDGDDALEEIKKETSTEVINSLNMHENVDPKDKEEAVNATFAAHPELVEFLEKRQHQFYKKQVSTDDWYRILMCTADPAMDGARVLEFLQYITKAGIVYDDMSQFMRGIEELERAFQNNKDWDHYRRLQAAEEAERKRLIHDAERKQREQLRIIDANVADAQLLTPPQVQELRQRVLGTPELVLLLDSEEIKGLLQRPLVVRDLHPMFIEVPDGSRLTLYLKWLIQQEVQCESLTELVQELIEMEVYFESTLSTSKGSDGAEVGGSTEGGSATETSAATSS